MRQAKARNCRAASVAAPRAGEDEADADTGADDSASRAPAGAYASLCWHEDSGSTDQAFRDTTRRAHLLRLAADSDRDLVFCPRVCTAPAASFRVLSLRRLTRSQ